MAKDNKRLRSERQIKEGVLRPEGNPSGRPPTSSAGGSGTSQSSGGSSGSGQGGSQKDK
jgi:hypothetical protein